MIQVTRQKKNEWRKRFRKATMEGSTYLFQQGGQVNVEASADHQGLCILVFGKPNAKSSSSESYLAWNDVKAIDIVELFYQMDN